MRGGGGGARTGLQRQNNGDTFHVEEMNYMVIDSLHLYWDTIKVLMDEKSKQLQE